MEVRGNNVTFVNRADGFSHSEKTPGRFIHQMPICQTSEKASLCLLLDEEDLMSTYSLNRDSMPPPRICRLVLGDSSREGLGLRAGSA